MDKIVIKGASQHNLKHVDLELPRNQLIVISGVSGSGKSSLAFDTIFAEGQRRYVESLSAYARQFLGRLDKPEVDYIEGLSPAVSIEQKTTHKNPRSTVGTVTEIYDYYRLLFARIGIPHCPQCGREIREQSVDQIVDIVLSYPEGTRLIVSAPVVMGRKGEFKKIFTDAADSGFVRVRVDGEVRLLSEEIELDKKQKHDIDIIVDRIVLSLDARHRTAESIETALSLTDGIVKIDFGNGEESRFFSQKSACVHCGISLPELQPRLFSFNNPYGACPECAGLGMTMDFAPELVDALRGIGLAGFDSLLRSLLRLGRNGGKLLLCFGVYAVLTGADRGNASCQHLIRLLCLLLVQHAPCHQSAYHQQEEDRHPYQHLLIRSQRLLAEQAEAFREIDILNHTPVALRYHKSHARAVGRELNLVAVLQVPFIGNRPPVQERRVYLRKMDQLPGGPVPHNRRMATAHRCKRIIEPDLATRVAPHLHLVYNNLLRFSRPMIFRRRPMFQHIILTRTTHQCAHPCAYRSGKRPSVRLCLSLYHNSLFVFHL